MSGKKPVYVTESFLPPKEEFTDLVNNIFESHTLTNQGPYVNQLESDLKKFLKLDHLVSCANGTLALQLAIRMFGLNGKKVITTPFTYVATLTSLMWENCIPVFADIDPQTLCLSPESAQAALEMHPDTAALMPVHVFGNACDVAGFAELAQKHNLKIIYDAAHAFGSELNGKSLLAHGDASTCSFHATKLFHSVEGGCIVAPNKKCAHKLGLLRAFGHIGDAYYEPGINAKMSELHAAMGLCVLKHTRANMQKRVKLAQIYNELLQIGQNPHLATPRIASGLNWNHAYYPVIFKSENILVQVTKALNQKNIFPRRYFYPSLTTLPYAPKQVCPVADDIAKRIICLPFWPDMPEDTLKEVAEIVVNNSTA